MSKLIILGDICPDNNFRPLFDNNPFGPFSEDIIDVFSNADVVIANLECPATESIAPIVKTGPNIKALPKDIDLLKKCGITHLSLANNHILDFGEKGFNDTIAACKKNGITFLGGGSDTKEAGKHTVINFERIKIGILAYAEEEFNLATDKSVGANHFDPYTSLDEISEFRKNVDYLIVLYHGGIEHYIYPSPDLQKKCRHMARKGADLVLIQHSHCIGTIEKVGNSTIVYGQGNSVFGFRPDEPSWNEGWLIAIDTDGLKLDFKLLRAGEEGVYFASKTEQDKRFEKFISGSEHLKDIEFLHRKWDEFCENMKSLDLPLLYGYGKWTVRLNRVLKNKLIKLAYSNWNKLVTLELIRCEAHHEVIKTILENDTKNYRNG